MNQNAIIGGPHMRLNKRYLEAEKVYRKHTVLSEKEYEKGKKLFPGGVTRYTNFYKPYPLTMIKGEGAYVFDIDGNRYLDYINNYGSLIHGHAQSEVLEAAKKAMEFGSAISASIPDQLELAELLCDRIPSFEKIRYCNSGLEATMFAIKIARAYTKKKSIIKMEGGFHGLHDIVEFSVSPPITGTSMNEVLHPKATTLGISEKIAEEVYIAPFNDVEAIREILEQNPNEIAAILVEPVMGLSGMILPKEGYLKGLRKLADKHNVLLIFDEIQTFRMDVGGAQSYYGVTPDLTTVAKIIGGGFPVGAFGGRADVMDVMDPHNDKYVNHGGTFSGNNVTVAAGIAAMNLFDKDAIAYLEMLSKRLEEGLLEAIHAFRFKGSVTRAGSMLHFHLSEQAPENYQQAHAFSTKDEIRNYMHLEFLNRGIFTSPRGTWYLSTAMTENQIDETAKIFYETLKKVSDYSQ